MNIFAFSYILKEGSRRGTKKLKTAEFHKGKELLLALECFPSSNIHSDSHSYLEQLGN